MIDIPAKIAEARSRHGRTFYGRAAIILTGSVAGQGIAFLLLPLITRVYAADVLGRSATVLAIVSISAMVVFFQYDQAVIVATDEELPPLLGLNIGLVLGWFGLISLLVFIDSALPSIGYAPLLAQWSIDLTLPVLVLTYGLFVLMTNFHLRTNRLGRVSLGRIVYYGIGATLQVLLGWLYGGSERSFLWAQVLASIAAVVLLIPYKEIFTWTTWGQKSTNFWHSVKFVANRYQKFPRFQMGAGLLNSISIYLPVIFMRAVFSDAWAGWYFLSWRLLAAPTTLLFQAIGQVFYRDSAERERGRQKQSQILEDTVVRLISVSTLPAVVLGISIPLLVEIFLGDAWTPVAGLVQVLLIGTIVSFFVSPISPLLNVKELQKEDFLFKGSLFLFRVIALSIGWYLQSPLSSILAYALISAIIMLFYFRFIIHSVEGSVKRVFARCLPILTTSCALIILALLLSYLGILYKPNGLALMCFAFLTAVWFSYKRMAILSSSKAPHL